MLNLQAFMRVSAMAEKEGFEPSMSYQPIHEFQSCAINRARRLLHALLVLHVCSRGEQFS